MTEIPRKFIVPKNITDALRTVIFPGGTQDVVSLDMAQEIRVAGKKVTFSLVFQRSDDNKVYAPGHNGFFKSPDGSEDWIVYHANDNPDDGCGGKRSTRVQKFTWNADGTPNFGIPVSTTMDSPNSSGDVGKKRSKVSAKSAAKTAGKTAGKSASKFAGKAKGGRR